MKKLKVYYRWFTNYLLARVFCFTNYALAPRVLSIETTERCNLDCIMCPRKQTSLSADEFTLEQFKHALSLFPSINTVILLGRGETLMMKDIFLILDFGTSKNIYFTIITNGTMLTPEIIKRLPDIGKILVSIDHPDAGKYKEIRRGGNLDVVIANLKALKKEKPSQWVCIQVVVMKSNIDCLVDFIKLAKNVGADAVKFIHPMIFDQRTDNIYIESSKVVNEKLAEAKKYAKKAGIRLVAVPSMSKPRVCVEPWLGLRVSINGDVYPCCYINNSADSSWSERFKGVALKIPQASYVMGNIHNGIMPEVWNGSAFRSLRKMIINTKRNKLMPDEQLNTLRKSLDMSQRFKYCLVCLYRQNRAC